MDDVCYLLKLNQRRSRNLMSWLSGSRCMFSPITRSCFMHSRNPYRIPPDFKLLGPELQPYLVQTGGHVTLDYQNDEALRCLTKLLLRRDFSLDIELPSNRLCPPLPNRLNYILWLQDLLDSLPVAQNEILGGDIGTGASAIYPFLGCSLRPNWRFRATELDETSFSCAFQNVKTNSMDDRIHIIRVLEHDTILGPLFRNMDSNQALDFTMCNPPFYESVQEIQTSLQIKEFPPNAICTGGTTEMITEGGEVQFVGNMIRESLLFKDRCHWFSSMLGKATSLESLVLLLRSSQIHNYAVTELVQGQTKRWAIAWSFRDERLPDIVARSTSSSFVHPFLPPKNELRASHAIQYACNTTPANTAVTCGSY
ncbi:hypothetical protein DL96DRAFT_931644 [Flagelloscypha sp. PMI_526]|nr:hypothetical protein DL96DRAFT_931644 [Flagelloscypha sp. PMI_526]